MNRFVDRIMEHRMVLAIACVLLIVSAGAGLGGLRLNASYTAYFDERDPLMRSHARVSSRFAGHENVAVVLQTSLADALEPQSLALLRTLIGAIESLPGVVDVRSILDVIDDLKQDETAESALDQILGPETGVASASVGTNAVFEDPRGRGLGVSHDGRALLIDIAYALPDSGDAEAVLDSLKQLRSTVAELTTPAAFDIDVRYSGSLALNEAYIQTVRHDVGVFAAALLFGMFFVLLALFRNFWVSAWMLFVGGGAAIAAFGAAGWLGFELAAIAAFAPVIIVSLSVAASVHMTSRYASHLAALPGDRAVALRSSLRENLLPLALTGTTTVLGFLALLLSPSPPIRVMGVIVAVGVLVSCLSNLLVFPLALGWAERPIRVPGMRMGQIAGFAHRNAPLLRNCFLLVGVLMLFLAGRSQVNDNVFEYFSSDHRFRTDTTVVHELFSGINRLTYVIDSKKAHGLFDKTLLDGVNGFTEWLRRQPEVSNSLAVTMIPRVQAALDRPDIEQTLARYRKLAEDFPVQDGAIGHLVDARYQATAVHVYLDQIDAKSIIAFDRRAAEWLDRNLEGATVSGGIGPTLLFAHLGQRNARSMLNALFVSVIVAAVLCGLITGSLRGALAGLFLNAFPVVCVYGVWALIGGYVSMGGAVVIGMILGIIVDDTLYLFAHFRRAMVAGRSVPARDSLITIGPALAITTLTLCAGFASGLLSEFSPISTMSLLSVVIISVALITDLLALPGFLMNQNHLSTLRPHEPVPAKR